MKDFDEHAEFKKAFPSAFEYFEQEDFLKQEASTMMDEIRLALLGGRYESVIGEYSQQEEELAWKRLPLLYDSVGQTQKAFTKADKESQAKKPAQVWRLCLIQEITNHAKADFLPYTLCLIPDSLWLMIADALVDYLTPEDRQFLLGLRSLTGKAKFDRATGPPPIGER